MILSRRSDTQFEFEMDVAEAEALRWLFSQYPVDDEHAFDVSKTSEGGDIDGAAEALTMSMDDLKRQLKGRVATFLEETDQIRESGEEGVTHLTVKIDDVEWMLQVLNETRVGAWRLLGCPEDIDEANRDEGASYGFLMEVAAFFQSALIYAYSPGMADLDDGEEPGSEKPTV